MIKNNIKEIEEEIKLNGHIEWRSKKNLDEFVLSNTFNKDICIVGFITPKTIQKWGLDLARSFDYVYVGVRKGRICYLKGLAIPPSSTHVLLYGSIYAQKKYLG